jgi:hypothetical protein
MLSVLLLEYLHCDTDVVCAIQRSFLVILLFDYAKHKASRRGQRQTVLVNYDIFKCKVYLNGVIMIKNTLNHMFSTNEPPLRSRILEKPSPIAGQQNSPHLMEIEDSVPF